MTRSLLVLSYFPAFWPARSGGEMRLGHLYRALAKGWSVTLISATDGNAAFAEVEHAEGFREMRVPKDATWSRAAAALGRSGVAGDVAGLAFALAAADPDWPLRRLARAAAGKASLVVHESPFSEPLFGDGDGVREVYSAHNHEASLIGDMTGGEGEGAAEAWLRVWRLERRLARRAALVLAPSVEDLDRMRILYGVEPHRLAEAPNGFDPEAARSVAARRGLGPSRGRRPALLFVGSAHPPNVEAARYLAGIAPELPQADIVIGGAAGDALPEDPPENLHRIGLLDETEKAGLLADAAAFLNPVDSGSGTSLKALEAVAAGIPLVSTPFGVRGLNLRDGQHALLRERGPGFVDGIREVLADPMRAALVSANAMGALELLAWPRIAEGVGRLLAEAAEGRFGPHAPTAQRRVLALNDYPVAGRETGGAVRIRETLSRLDADVVLLGFAPRPSIRRIAENVVALGLPKSAPHRAFERDLATVWEVPSEDVVAALFVARNGPVAAVAADLARDAGAAILEHGYMAPLLDLLTRARPELPVVYASHNVEGALKRGLGGRHAAGALAAGIAEGVERRLVAEAALVVACAEDDAAVFQRLGARTLLVPHGAKAVPAAEVEPEGPPVAGFLGSAHGPNREAAAFLAAEIAPRLPGVVFEIVGEVCAALDGPLPPNVRLCGPLPPRDKTEALHGWALALNPVESGGGANLKLADYLAHGLPVLATPFGGRGLPLARQGLGHVVPRSGFARAVEAVLADREGRRQAGARARAFAQSHLSWDRLTLPYRAEIAALMARPRRLPTSAGLVVATDLALDTEEGLRALLAAIDRLGTGAERIDVVAPLSGPAPASARIDRIVAVGPGGSAGADAAARIRLVEAGARFLNHPAPLAVAGLEPADAPDGPGWRIGAAFALLLPARARALRVSGTTEAPLVLRLSSRQLGGGGGVAYPPIALEDAFDVTLPLQGGPRPRLLEGRLDGIGGEDDRPLAAISAAAASAEGSAAGWQRHLPLALDAGDLLRARAPGLHREAAKGGPADPAATAAWAAAVASLGRQGPSQALLLFTAPQGAAASAARAALAATGWPVVEAAPDGGRPDPWSPIQIADQRAGLDEARGAVALADAQGVLGPRGLLDALGGAGLDLDVIVPDRLAARRYRTGRAAVFLPAAPEAWLPRCRALVVAGWDGDTPGLIATARTAGIPVLAMAGAEGEADAAPGLTAEAVAAAIARPPAAENGRIAL
ncbi:glycosyltransferase [Methylobacterium sp. sgz302541]|uniref:glycosyltransferase n=1 Tax=unclassified Methylobacterium TaxID=2615210 RepID=UPI003D32E08D